MLRWALSLCWQRPILQGGSWKATMRRLPIWLRSVTSVQCQLLTGHWWCLRQPPSGSGCSWLQARPIFAAQLWLFLATRSMFSINKVEGDLFIFWKEWHHRTVSCLCHLFSKCAKVSFLSQLIGSTQNSVQADECNKYVGLASGTCSQEIVSKGYQLPPASYDLIKGPSFLLNMLYNLALHPVALYPPKPHWRGCCLTWWIVAVHPWSTVDLPWSTELQQRSSDFFYHCECVNVVGIYPSIGGRIFGPRKIGIWEKNNFLTSIPDCMPGLCGHSFLMATQKRFVVAV